MSRYDGLIIPRSYSEYINKTDAATLQQALQLSGVLSGAVAEGDNKAVKSSAVNTALGNYNYSEVQNGGSYIQRYGKFVNLLLYIPINETITGAYKDYENFIPSGYRPPRNIYVMGQNEGGYENIEIGVYSNGTIRVYKNNVAITNLVCNVIYLIA